MIPRRIHEIEERYWQKFPNSKARLFFDELEPEKWLTLLQKAVERGKPLTKDEIREYFGDQAFETELELISSWYGMKKEEILKGLE